MVLIAFAIKLRNLFTYLVEYAYNFSHYVNRFTMPNTPNNLFYRFLTKQNDSIEISALTLAQYILLLFPRNSISSLNMASSNWPTNGVGSSRTWRYSYNDYYCIILKQYRKPIRTGTMYRGLSQWAIGRCIVPVICSFLKNKIQLDFDGDDCTKYDSIVNIGNGKQKTFTPLSDSHGSSPDSCLWP